MAPGPDRPRGPGSSGFNTPARIVAIGAAGRIFDRFAVEPASARWIDALGPLHDLLTASLGDSEPILRAAALDEIRRLWVWLPGRSLTPVEESSLVRWKENIYQPVIRCLGQRDARTLVAAVKCLGALPVDKAASPALAYIDNPNSEVRKQTILSFARRNLLLTDDLLTRLFDDDPTIREAVDGVLKLRGLSRSRSAWAALIFSPSRSSGSRSSRCLKDRTDVDPAIWLIHLSRDPEEMVRISAVEAMAVRPGRQSVRQRLAEMARSDLSDAVRKAAGKIAPPVRERTARPAAPTRFDRPESEGELRVCFECGIWGEQGGNSPLSARSDRRLPAPARLIRDGGVGRTQWRDATSV